MMVSAAYGNDPFNVVQNDNIDNMVSVNTTKVAGKAKSSSSPTYPPATSA